jgi:hypothetical protein
VAGSKSNKNSDINLVFFIVKAPPAKAGDFRLRLKAGSICYAADFHRYTMIIPSAGFGGF